MTENHRNRQQRSSAPCRGPRTTVTAVDGDAYTSEVAEREMKEQGLSNRFRFVHSMLEDLELDGGHDLALINISLHEARDIERAVARAHAALEHGGRFVVSEFPLPEHEDGCRTVPGRLMCGVQLSEAHVAANCFRPPGSSTCWSGAGSVRSE